MNNTDALALARKIVTQPNRYKERMLAKLAIDQAAELEAERENVRRLVELVDICINLLVATAAQREIKDRLEAITGEQP